MYTKQTLIDTAKKSSWNIIDTFIPNIEQHWLDFVEGAGINDHFYFNSEKYIYSASYSEKRNVFERLGFHVLFLSLSAIKVSQFVTDNTNGQNNKSINQQFLDGERNVMIIDVTSGTQSLYFVIEYKDDNDQPLAEYTVDRDEVARHSKQKERAGAFLAAAKARREAKNEK